MQENFCKRNDKSFQLDLVTSHFVKIQLQNLKTNKAIGLDKISARLLKDSADIIAPSLQALINKSFREGKFPSNWKSAKVVPLHSDPEWQHNVINAKK